MNKTLLKKLIREEIKNLKEQMADDSGWDDAYSKAFDAMDIDNSNNAKQSIQKMADALGDFLEQYDKVRIIGGCCGTNPKHIESLRKIIDEKASSIKG